MVLIKFVLCFSSKKLFNIDILYFYLVSILMLYYNLKLNHVLNFNNT